MRSATRALVDQWVADLLGMSVSTVWHPGVSVVGHAGLGEYPGIWVLRRAGAVRLSVPPAMVEAVAGRLADRAPDELVDPAFWRRFEPTRDFVVLGPSIHAFTDGPVPAEPPDVEQVDPSELTGFLAAARPEDRAESGFGEDVPIAFAARSGRAIVAAANLTAFRGEPTDVGVLTSPAHRGCGHGTRVAGAATADAVHRCGLARYRALADNAPSRVIAATLGFEDRFEQLAIRPAL